MISFLLLVLAYSSISESNNDISVLSQFLILLHYLRFVVDVLFFLPMKNNDGEDVVVTLIVVAVDMNGEMALKVTR